LEYGIIPSYTVTLVPAVYVYIYIYTVATHLNNSGLPGLPGLPQVYQVYQVYQGLPGLWFTWFTIYIFTVYLVYQGLLVYQVYLYFQTCCFSLLLAEFFDIPPKNRKKTLLPSLPVLHRKKNRGPIIDPPPSISFTYLLTTAAHFQN
jgi:hypothetical protein